ncbi:tellurite resistance TerB family protein [Roseomonas marmotae]|uniref:Tellurite resistance TerB family protein n=1 Tax=Roseomonas marmotae TaxID=2768161 RepID=A0ABS3KGC1_9PROT|nr:tellurite resistance TerB family protein [Roseomonas marmotae]MBO1076523.1 tellurite resistance TerB family protein [Roseomonas marmotae]QTI81860.1 tellurite resistance TerB family protein [Roseomonas marmotae]
MIDPKMLLDRFLGPGSKGGDQLGSLLGQMTGGKRASPWGQQSAGASSGIPGGILGGAAGAGLIGLLLGGRKKGKGVGGLLSHGGAAALGALAYRAYQNWQQGQAPASAAPATVQDVQAADAGFGAALPAADGQPFALALVRAMIGAAKADGHVDAEEQQAIFAHVEQAGLDAEAKALVFDALSQPTDLNAIAASARTQEQGAELYLATRLAIDPDHPAEHAYLDALAHRLKLPADLAAHLNAQAEAASGA